MIQELYEKHIFLYIMGGLCVLGVLLKCILLIIYNKLIISSENMAQAKKSWLKNMKLRFESSYHLKLGVNDVDTYVDKYVSKIKCGGLLLSTWENISGQTIGLCLLTGSFAGILGYVYECGQGPVLFTFFMGAWTAIIVNIVDNIVNISAHKQMLRYNLIDYFENNLKVRMEQEIFHADARKKYQREYFDEEKEDISAEGSDLHKIDLNESRATAATLELREKRARRQEREQNLYDDNSRDSKVLEAQEKKENDITIVKVSKSEKRESLLQAKKQAKSDKRQEKLDLRAEKKKAKEDKKQQKLDEKAAKKKEKKDRKLQKHDMKLAKKQEKLDAIEEKKHSRLVAKQTLINKKIEKRDKREELREARERAEIEAIQAKRKVKEEEKNQREKLERDRKQKEIQNNKAYREKMRLKEEKEREAAKREEENNRIKEAKKTEKEERVVNEDAYHEIDEILVKQEIKNTIMNTSLKFISSKQDDLLDEESMEFEAKDDKESLDMTAISKEEDMLIEEVLKDFLF